MVEKEIGMENQQLKQITKIIKALSDESRLRIICLLKHRGNICVCEITAIIGLAQPTISSHLKLLESAGLIDSYKDGLWVNYNIRTNLDSFTAELIETLYKSLIVDKQIKSDIQKLKNVDRDKLCKRKTC
jgi:ArsR family transcriptional regulator